jgi:hypothetical protein
MGPRHVHIQDEGLVGDESAAVHLDRTRSQVTPLYYRLSEAACGEAERGK